MFPPFELALFGADAVPGGSSALARVSRGAPPFLIAHGDSDRVVPAKESAALHEALGRVGVASTLTYLAAAGHEDPAFDRSECHAMTAAWLRSILLAEGAGG